MSQLEARSPYLFFGIFMLLLILFNSSVAGASENPLLVKLPAEINAGMAKIYAIGEQFDRVVKAKELQIKRVVEQIEASTNERETFAIQKEYLALRAEVLQAQAKRSVAIENELAKVVQNIDLLEQVRKDSKKYGLGKGISKEDPQAKAAVRSMLGGFKNLVDMVDRLNPASQLGNQRDSLIVMTNMANSFFGMDDNSGLENQRRFLKDAMVMARSVQGILGLEHDHLMQKLYYIDAQHIVQQFGDLKVAIFGKGITVADGFNKWHQLDDQALRSRGSSQPSGYGGAQPGWEGVGIIK